MNKLQKKIIVFATCLVMVFSTMMNTYALDFGFVTTSKGVYFQKDDGSKHKGFLKYEGSWYYFKSDGYMLRGWQRDANNQPIRYFDKYRGWMYTGWIKTNDNYRYFSKSNGLMAKGWIKNANGQYRYFSKSSGVMAVGWVKNSAGDYRYFNKGNGVMFVGWQYDKTGAPIRFFNRNTGVMMKNITAWVEGKYYKFGSNGIIIR